MEISLLLIENNIICQNPGGECQELDESKFAGKNKCTRFKINHIFKKNACDICFVCDP